MAEGYIGHDAIIRGYKDSSLYNNWSGILSDKFLTFCSNYEGRYPAELKFLLEAMAGSDLLIGGGSNQHIDQSIGLVTLEEQVNLLQTCFGYVYFHGSEVPYTLNFIEAWMTGIPVFVIDRSDNSLGQDLIFNEVNDITMNGINAFKVKSPQQASEIVRSMLSQRSVYAEVGRAGRLAAIAMFGKERAQDDWRHFLNRLLIGKPR